MSNLYQTKILNKKSFKFFLIINVYNEGNALHKYLRKIKKKRDFGVLIADSPSTDNSTNIKYLKKFKVDILLKMKKRSDHSVTLMSVLDFFIKSKKYENLEGIIICDGNGKDNPNYVKFFIKKIKEGFDFIQGSRFLKKNMEKNTPYIRKFLIKFIHAPLTSIACRKKFTDSTNGFRGISFKFIKKKFKIISKQRLRYYEFYFYLAFLASRTGYKIIEIPVTRIYPKGKVPTKIQTFKQYWEMFKPPFYQAIGIKYKLN